MNADFTVYLLLILGVSVSSRTMHFLNENSAQISHDEQCMIMKSIPFELKFLGVFYNVILHVAMF